MLTRYEQQWLAAAELFKTQTWAERKWMIETYRDLLLTESIEQQFADIIASIRDTDANELPEPKDDMIRIIQWYRTLLTHCRQKGIERTFADFLPAPQETYASELSIIMGELQGLTTAPSDIIRSIVLGQVALTLVTRERQPEMWAGLQVGLAGSILTQADLGGSPLGDLSDPRVDKIEEALGYSLQALEVFTPQSYPIPWALTQGNLINAYVKRTQGNRAENLEKALSHGLQALDGFSRQEVPEIWGGLHTNMGIAYANRIRGDRAENLEKAIDHYHQALQVLTRQQFPEEWALLHMNMAHDFVNRIRGDRAENLEKAIDHYHQALQVLTRQQFPEHWGKTQTNLAVAYAERIRGDRGENLEKAIDHYHQALEVFSRDHYPTEWARALISMARGYELRIRGDRAENLEKAIDYNHQALQVYTRQANPMVWAMGQHNLGNAYAERIRGDRAKNLEEAIDHYHQALNIRTTKVLPADCRDTAFNLGLVLYAERRFSEARMALVTAHEAVEALRSEVQREEAKRTLAEKNADLYASLVHCCLLEGDQEAAYRYATAGKGRALADLLATARLDLSAAGAHNPELAEDLRKARALRQQIDNVLARITNEDDFLTPDGGTERRASTATEADLSVLQEREVAFWDEMAYKYPALTATQRAPTFAVNEASALAGELDATLVEYYQHAGGWCAFIITPEGMRYVPLPNVDEELLERMFLWLIRIQSPSGRGKVSYLPLHRLHEALITPLRSHLPLGEQVVLALFGPLNLLPLIAALDPTTGRYVSEDYMLAFAPSLAALRVSLEQESRRTSTQDADSANASRLGKRRITFDLSSRAVSADRRTTERLLCVAYPGAPDSGHYLPNVLPEAEAVAHHFAQVTQLHGDSATPEAVLSRARGQDVVHFGCHGWFDPEAPAQSGLMLSGGWLTLQRVITELYLDRTRLATISACVSGWMQLREGEEHVGLLQALMTAGARAVVASLWAVNDASTRALFEAFYTELAAGQSPARALADAAQEVRRHPEWKHPYYWAAFQASGLAYGVGEPRGAQQPPTLEGR